MQTILYAWIDTSCIQTIGAITKYLNWKLIWKKALSDGRTMEKSQIYPRSKSAFSRSQE